MSEPSNGAWPFQEIPEEEGLDISAIFGNSSAAPQGDPFAPPAAAQSVPLSPTPVAQEITPAVAATSQPTTAPIAKAPVEAPAENPIAAAFEQKTAENTKKGLLEKPPVFYHKGVKEEIDDPSMTFEELRIRKSDDFTDLEEGKRVSWSVEYCGIRKEVKDPKGTTIISMKEMIERSREFLDALKKTKDKAPCCYVKPKVEMKTKGNAAYKGKFGTLEEARTSDILTKVLPYLGYQMALSSHLDPALTPIKSPNFFRRDAYARTYACLSAYLPTIDIWNEYKNQNPETLEKPWNTLRKLYQDSNPDISDLTAAIPYTVFPSGLLCHHGRNISFCHDNYRDFFAAFHIANVVYGLYSGIDLAALSPDAQEVFLLQLETLDNSILFDAISILIVVLQFWLCGVLKCVPI